MNIVILPGNPPSKYHYELWMSELMKKLPGDKFFYLDYLSPDLNKAAETELKKMVKDIKRNVSELTKNGPTIIIAHSFGGYFALNLEKKKQRSLFLIFPFLGQPKTFGKFILSVATRLPKGRALNVISSFIQKLPGPLFAEIKNVEESEIKKGFKIATIENKLFKKKILIEKLENDQSSKLIFNPKDRWSPPAVTKRLQKYFPSEKTLAKHDFILSSKQRDILTETFVRYRNSVESTSSNPSRQGSPPSSS